MRAIMTITNIVRIGKSFSVNGKRLDEGESRWIKSL